MVLQSPPIARIMERRFHFKTTEIEVPEDYKEEAISGYASYFRDNRAKAESKAGIGTFKMCYLPGSDFINRFPPPKPEAQGVSV